MPSVTRCRVFFCNSGAEANEGAFKFARRWGRSARRCEARDRRAARGVSWTAFRHARGHGSAGVSHSVPTARAGSAIVERDIDDLAIALESRDRGRGRFSSRCRARAACGCSMPASCAQCARSPRNEGHRAHPRRDPVRSRPHGNVVRPRAEGIEPDMLTLAKPIAGGLPMGAVLMTKAIAAHVSPGDHGTTFGGGPFVPSVGLHVFDRLSDPRCSRT